MEAYIIYSFPSTKPNKPWFNSACSRAIRGRMLPSGTTVVFKLQNLTQLIFHPGIVQNLFYEIQKTLFSNANAMIFLAPLPLALSGILQKMSTLTLLLPLSLL